MWLLEQKSEGMIPDMRDPRKPGPVSGPTLPQLLQDKNRIRRGSYGRTQKRNANAEQMDRELSEEDWYKVIESYKHSGVPAVISQQTGLREAQVKHLITNGIWRLNLPPIKEFMVNFAEVNKRLNERNLPAIHNAPGLLDEHEIEAHKAITDRVSCEAVAATKALGMASLASSLVVHYVRSVVDALQDGKAQLYIPEAIDAKMIEQLANITRTATAAINTGVKVSRLAAGEPTEILSTKIAGLLEGLSIEELEDVERRNILPYRIRATMLGEGSKTTVIDADGDSETVQSGESGESKEAESSQDPIAEALAFQREEEEEEGQGPDQD